MTTYFDEDATIYFDPMGPGISQATINGVTLNGELDRDFDEALDAGTVRRWVPVFRCALAALPTVNKGDVLQIGTSAYKVREVESNDFEPIATLHLNNP